MKKLTVNIVSESVSSVQGHGVHTAYIETIRALKKYTDVKVVEGRIGERVDSDVVHLHTIGSRVWSKLLQRGPKKVVSAHVVPDSFVGSLIMAKYWRFAASWYMWWFYNRADLLLAVSEEAKQDLIKIGVKRPIEIMHNFIDTTKYAKPTTPRHDIRKSLGIPDDAFVVIGAGQVQPRKRTDDFVSAAKKLPNVHFVWVGGIPFGMIAADNAGMKKMMDNKTANMHFAGIVPLEDMSSYYHAADLFWLPSEQETFGLVVIEAAASGLPILLRDIPDYADTFGAGALYATNVAGFVEKIESIRDDKVLRKTWQTHAKTIAQRFDSKTAAKQLADIYRRVVEN